MQEFKSNNYWPTGFSDYHPLSAEAIRANDDFMRGQQDCIDGKDHKEGQSSWYDRGYSSQYQQEQNLTERTQNVR